MKKGDIWIIFAFVIIVACTVFYNYNKYLINRDFVVNAETDCDPKINDCFIIPCMEENDCEVIPYAKITKQASNIKNCSDPLNCDSLFCEQGEIGCKIDHCSEPLLDREMGEVCTNQEDYILEESQLQDNGGSAQTEESLLTKDNE